MEGNDCYKFSTIRNYLDKTGQPPIKVVFDVGANVGDICLMMSGYFPEAKIYGFEPIAEYFEIAKARTQHLPQIHLLQQALSGQHVFMDDLGEFPRSRRIALKALKGAPEAGPGWCGGSVVLAED